MSDASPLSPNPAESESDVWTRLAAALGAKYTVRRLLGRGGFAEVYEVWDTELERRLAVKVLRPDVAWTPGMLARFRQETRAVARLNHPNILPIHFVGEGDGIVYYAMPFVEGRSLGDMLRTSGALTPDAALDLALPILDALQHAHESGLLHRDIKPENVMIERGGKPLLMDFGIAKQLDASKGMTQTGFVVGTPQYMSPEQALGDTTLDARSDLYSMGAVLFQMLTGAPPFEGETSQEVVAQHISLPPPAPSAVNPQVPAWLSEAVVRALAKRPADRFQSALDMRRVLEQGRGPTVVSRAMPAAARHEDTTLQIKSGEAAATTQREQPAARREPPAQAAPGPVPAATPRRSPAAREATAVVAAGGVGGRRGRKWLWPAALGGVALVGALIAFLVLNRPVLVFENHLVEPVRIGAGGQERVVEPGGSVQTPLPRRRSLVAEWRLIRPTSRRGLAMGTEVGGRLVLDDVRGHVSRAAEARSDEAAYFAPLITNETGEPITIIVNAGLAGAMPCNCVVPPGTTRMPIGYYPLFRNSTVRAEARGGREATFTELGPQVDAVSGVVGLRFGPTDLQPVQGPVRPFRPLRQRPERQ